MKKIVLILSVLSILTILSCKKKDEKPMTPKVETTTVTAPSAPVASRQAKDSSSIIVGADGVNVTTKSGATKTSVNISGGTAKIEVKK